METKMSIYTTREYGVFKSHIHNRKLNEKNIKNMMESIVRYGLIQPIITSSDSYVIDGQHRLAACIRLGLPVTYVVNYSISSKAVTEANNTQRKWTTDDWVNHYAKKGSVDYISLSKKIKQYKNIPSGKLMYCFFDRKGNPNSAIKKGEYKINIELGDEILENCYKVNLVFKDALHTRFIRAIKVVMLNNPDIFDVNELISKMAMKKFQFYYNEADVVSEIIEVYNYKRKTNLIS